MTPRAAAVLVLLASLGLLGPGAHARTPNEESQRCGAILAALSERHAEEAVELSPDPAATVKPTLEQRNDIRRKFSAMVGFVLDLAGDAVQRRERVADATVGGSDALIWRELWMFPGSKAIRLGCVRYTAADGWVTTQLQFGDDMDAVTANLWSAAQRRASAAPR